MNHREGPGFKLLFVFSGGGKAAHVLDAEGKQICSEYL